MHAVEYGQSMFSLIIEAWKKGITIAWIHAQDCNV